MGRFIFWATFLIAQFTHADCQPEGLNEDFILKVDYFVFSNMQDVEARYREVFESGRRLKNRLYKNKDDQFVVDHLGKPQRIPPDFVESLNQQLAAALDRRYGEYLFYPDLGHAHLMLPKESLNLENQTLTLEAKLSSPHLVLLYHTAELVEMKKGFTGPLSDDPWLQWRYYSRNFVSPIGDPQNLAVLISDEPKYNTVRSLPGYSEVGRVYFSASKSGCLNVQRENGTIPYDLNFN